MDDASFSTIVDRLIRKDAAAADAAAQNDEREHRLESWLLPAVTLRCAERDLLRRKLEALEAVPPAHPDAPSELLQMESELAKARREIDGLRGSMSWRVTAPLRWAYGWLLRLQGRV